MLELAALKWTLCSVSGLTSSVTTTTAQCTTSSRPSLWKTLPRSIGMRTRCDCDSLWRFLLFRYYHKRLWPNDDDLWSEVILLQPSLDRSFASDSTVMVLSVFFASCPMVLRRTSVLRFSMTSWKFPSGLLLSPDPRIVMAETTLIFRQKSKILFQTFFLQSHSDAIFFFYFSLLPLRHSDYREGSLYGIEKFKAFLTYRKVCLLVYDDFRCVRIPPSPLRFSPRTPLSSVPTFLRSWPNSQTWATSPSPTRRAAAFPSSQPWPTRWVHLCLKGLESIIFPVKLTFLGVPPSQQEALKFPTTLKLKKKNLKNSLQCRFWFLFPNSFLQYNL